MFEIIVTFLILASKISSKTSKSSNVTHNNNKHRHSKQVHADVDVTTDSDDSDDDDVVSTSARRDKSIRWTDKPPAKKNVRRPNKLLPSFTSKNLRPVSEVSD